MELDMLAMAKLVVTFNGLQRWRFQITRIPNKSRFLLETLFDAWYNVYDQLDLEEKNRLWQWIRKNIWRKY